MKKSQFTETLSFNLVVPETMTMVLGNSGVQIGVPHIVSLAELPQGAVEGDFMDVLFRQLSATIVGAGTWKAADFSSPGVLKPATKMLANKTVYGDHYKSVDNWLGVTLNPKWEEEYVASNGAKIPAGINATVRIDAKSNPKVARGIQMGAIHSMSVTVGFDWDPSHTYDSLWEFYDKLGTIDPGDGKMVRRIATKIKEIAESSLVWMGADPFAKRINEQGQIEVPKKTGQFSFSALTTADKENRVAQAREQIEYCLDPNVLSLAQATIQPAQTPPAQQQKSTIMYKKLIDALIARYGTSLNFSTVPGADLTEAEIIALCGVLGTAPETPATPDAALTTFIAGTQILLADNTLSEFKLPAEGSFTLVPNTELVRLQTEVTKIPTLEAAATMGNAFLTFKRDECKRLYGLAAVNMNDATKNTILSLIDKMNPAELDATITQYGGTASHGFTATCPKCGSVELAMRSSVDTDGDADNDEKPEIRDSSYFINKFGR